MAQTEPQATPAKIWTIGHSTRPLDAFLGLLHEYRIEAVADVRRFPGSRRYPYFARDALAATLSDHGIEYQWLPKLGGRRKAQADSPNSAWRNTGFRGYADYLATAEFAEGLDDVLALATRRRTAIMCAEAVWWRCHRSLIADVLCVRGIDVLHILDARHTIVHPMTAPARIVAGKLTYAPAMPE
jgi:uncharacterized protein (DUF488 family)